jgi:hypothetical protein
MRRRAKLGSDSGSKIGAYGSGFNSDQIRLLLRWGRRRR